MPDTAAKAADNIRKVLRAGRAGIPRDLDEIGSLLTNALTVELSTPGRGRLYGRHRASAPGDPPAPDTGRLRASYGFTTARTGAGGELTVGTGDKKAKWLEFGTSRMRPRPHLRPVMLRNRTRITRIIARNFEARERAMARRLS